MGGGVRFTVTFVGKGFGNVGISSGCRSGAGGRKSGDVESGSWFVCCIYGLINDLGGDISV